MVKQFMQFMVFMPGLVWGATTTTMEKNWSGLYGGGNIGGRFSSIHLQAQHLALSNFNGQCSQNSRNTDGFIGAQAGMLQQLQNRFVVGVEGAFTSQFSNHHREQCTCALDEGIYDRFTVSYRDQGMVKGRLGYATHPNVLPYFAAGASFANLGFTYQNEASEHYATHPTRSSLLLGAGVEWAYSPKWSIRLEYAYNQYQHVSMPIPHIYGTYDAQSGSQYHFNTNEISAALNYWL